MAKWTPEIGLDDCRQRVKRLEADNQELRETLRDRFAMSVIQGWLASWPSELELSGDDAQEAVARFAYHMADLMIEARKSSAREQGDDG